MTDQDKIKRLEAENERLRTGINQAVAALWSFCFSIKQKRLTDIYDDLTALNKKQPEKPTSWDRGYGL